MAYKKCKIYFDGSHHIAIPPQPKKPRPKKGAKVKMEVPELEELDAEDKDCPFDKPVQLSLFDGEKREEALPESSPADDGRQRFQLQIREKKDHPSEHLFQRTLRAF